MPARRVRVCNHSRIARIRRTTLLLIAALVTLTALPAAASASTNTLGTYGTLTAGQSIVSPDGHYELVMQSDGNLVEYIVGGRALWATGTAGDSGAHALMQAGGNLVVYTPAGAVWSSNSRGTGCPNLVIQNDGNTVIYTTPAIWATHTVQSVMRPGDLLRPGWSIYSPSEDFELIMQGDGNLVLYRGGGQALWSSRTNGHPGAFAAMQTDGNLVVYAPGGPALWATGTYNHPGDILSMQSDGNLVVYNGSTPEWASGTNGAATTGSVAPKVPAPVTSCPPPAPPPAPPAPPVVTKPVTVPIPQPDSPHELAVKIKMSWTWNHAITRLHRVKLGSFPGNSQIFVQCRGRGCPGKRNISARGARHVRRLLRALRDKRYHAGDRVLIILKAPGYLPERALVKIRMGRLPRTILLPP